MRKTPAGGQQSRGVGNGIRKGKGCSGKIHTGPRGSDVPRGMTANSPGRAGMGAWRGNRIARCGLMGTGNISSRAPHPPSINDRASSILFLFLHLPSAPLVPGTVRGALSPPCEEGTTMFDPDGS